MDMMPAVSPYPAIERRRRETSGRTGSTGLDASLGDRARRWYYTHVWQLDIDPTATFAPGVHFDLTFPRGVHVGARTVLAAGVVVFTHDRTRGLYLHTRIGRDCHLGENSIVLPGLTIGDGSVVAAGAVVTKDLPPGSRVVGNPAIPTVTVPGQTRPAYSAPTIDRLGSPW